MKKWIFIIFVVCMAGCFKKSQEKKTSEDLEYGYQLMKSQRYNEAVDYFKKLNVTHPSQDTQIGLASALAGRAGVQIDRYWGFTVGYGSDGRSDFEKINQQELLNRWSVIASQNNLNGIIPDRDAKKLLLEAGRILGMVEVFSARYAQIHLVDMRFQKDLSEALQILQINQSRGSKIFKVILEIIIFRSQVEIGKALWAGWLHEQNLCDIELAPFVVWVEGMIENSLELHDDLMLTFPSQALAVTSSYNILVQVRDWLQIHRLEMMKGTICP